MWPTDSSQQTRHDIVRRRLNAESLKRSVSLLSPKQCSYDGACGRPYVRSPSGLICTEVYAVSIDRVRIIESMDPMEIRTRMETGAKLYRLLHNSSARKTCGPE